jgi:hypothetical protein
MSIDGKEAPRRQTMRWLRFSLAGVLFFFFCWAGLWSGYRLGAQRLGLNPDPLQLTMLQRSNQDIPGFKGKASIAIEDITRGQAMVSILNRTKTPVVGPVSVQAGDVLPFVVEGQQFFLHVARLENELIGDDVAVMELSSVDRWTPTK